MIEIKKNREPGELAQYRNLPGASYNDMHGAPTTKKSLDGQSLDVYHVVLDSLIEEQGGLCAYCMKRIPVHRGMIRATIEHIQPQNMTDKQEAMNYRNMIAVCPGNRDANDNKDKTCDARRGSLQPEDQNMTINPLQSQTISTIEYKEDGEIFSHNDDVNKDLNFRLNLNCKSRQLAKCRAEALKELQNKVYADNKDRRATKEYYQKLLADYMQLQNKRAPYVGILLYWLKKKIK